MQDAAIHSITANSPNEEQMASKLHHAFGLSLSKKPKLSTQLPQAEINAAIQVQNCNRAKSPGSRPVHIIRP